MCVFRYTGSMFQNLLNAHATIKKTLDLDSNNIGEKHLFEQKCLYSLYIDTLSEFEKTTTQSTFKSHILLMIGRPMLIATILKI